MLKKLLVLTILIGLVVGESFYIEEDDEDFGTEEDDDDEEEYNDRHFEILTAQNFTFDLLRTQFVDSENVVLSPYALRSLLCILYQGSFGETEEEIKRILKLGSKHKAGRIQPRVQRKLINRSDYLNKIIVKPDGLYGDLVAFAGDLDARVTNTDFTNPREAANRINQLYSFSTENEIDEIVKPNMFTPNTEVFLTSSLTTRYLWTYQFPSGDTQLQDFTNSRGQTKRVRMMKRFSTFKYLKYEELDVEVVEMTFTAEHMSFWAVLPGPTTNLRNVLKDFSSGLFREFKFNSTEIPLTIYIPEFDISTDYDAKELLTRHGFTSLFTKNEIRLGYSGPLKVSGAKQKLKIRVTALGVNPDLHESYVNNVLPQLNRKDSRLVPEIRFNRPFLYLVNVAPIEKNKKLPIIVGHYSNP